jgi:cytochrome P450
MAAPLTELEFNPFSPEFQADPYPVYRWLRAEDPVHYVELPGLELMGLWLLTRHADVTAVLRDERFSARKQLMSVVESSVAVRPLTSSMLVVDPPDHTRMRMLVTKAFTPRVIEGLRPRIQELVDAALDRVAADGEMDVIRDLAYPLPVTVIAELLGVPAADHERFKQWSDDVAVLADGTLVLAGLAHAEESMVALETYLSAVFAERRIRPQGDLISALVAAREQEQVLSEAELFATCVLLLVAGNETTTNLIGNGMLALLRNRDQLALLGREPGLIRPAIEELLRYDSPVQLTSRTPTVDVEIGGKVIRAGQEVDLVLGAANRDPAAFVEPDRLDITRADNRHVSFGQGIHFCLGAPLARLEGQIAIQTLVRRFPGLRLATDVPEWRPGLVLHGLKSLPVVF